MTLQPHPPRKHPTTPADHTGRDPALDGQSVPCLVSAEGLGENIRCSLGTGEAMGWVTGRSTATMASLHIKQPGTGVAVQTLSW